MSIGMGTRLRQLQKYLGGMHCWAVNVERGKATAIFSPDSRASMLAHVTITPLWVQVDMDHMRKQFHWTMFESVNAKGLKRCAKAIRALLNDDMLDAVKYACDPWEGGLLYLTVKAIGGKLHQHWGYDRNEYTAWVPGLSPIRVRHGEFWEVTYTRRLGLDSTTRTEECATEEQAATYIAVEIFKQKVGYYG